MCARGKLIRFISVYSTTKVSLPIMCKFIYIICYFLMAFVWMLKSDGEECALGSFIPTWGIVIILHHPGEGTVRVRGVRLRLRLACVYTPSNTGACRLMPRSQIGGRIFFISAIINCHVPEMSGWSDGSSERLCTNLSEFSLSRGLWTFSPVLCGSSYTIVCIFLWHIGNWSVSRID